MEISNELEWDSNDIANLKNFLGTKTGLRCVPKILEQVPALLAKGEINEILIRSGQVQGFSMAVQTILSLTSPPAPPAPTERNPYPNLFDDAAHNDGQTLTEKK